MTGAVVLVALPAVPAATRQYQYTDWMVVLEFTPSSAALIWVHPEGAVGAELSLRKMTSSRMSCPLVPGGRAGVKVAPLVAVAAKPAPAAMKVGAAGVGWSAVKRSRRSP